MKDILKTISIALPVCGLIFQAGKQSEKVEDLYTKMDMQVVEQKSIREILHSMDTKLCVIEQDIKHILTDRRKQT